MNPNDRKLIVQIVGQVLISDGILTDPEREYLDALMDRLHLEQGERSEALGGISVDSPIEERVGSLSAEAKQTAIDEAVRAVGIDSSADHPVVARVRAAATSA
jgi:hypothetical protein